MMYSVLKINIKMETYNTSQEGQSFVQQSKKITSVVLPIKFSTQMDDDFKKLEQLRKEMEMIVVDSKNPHMKQTMEKKLQDYNRICALVEESTQLLNRMEMEINKINENHIDQIQNSKINDWLEMLMNKDRELRIDEIYYIVEQLQAMLNSVSSETEISDNINPEIIYEKHDVYDD